MSYIWLEAGNDECAREKMDGDVSVDQVNVPHEAGRN